MTSETGLRPLPLADPRGEALVILHEAASRGLSVRAVGGIAVSLRCPSAAHPPLQRPYKDIDLVGPSAQRRSINQLLTDLSYEPSAQFNALHGRTRLLYWDTEHGRQLDVFLDRIVMCHTLEVEDRLDVDALTLPTADLLLTKLQVIETNERDLRDAAALLIDGEIDVARVARVLAQDWGWWRTVTEVLGKVEAYGTTLPDFTRADELRERIRELHERIDAEPKSVRWKLRARLGDRVRWYELPEED